MSETETPTLKSLTVGQLIEMLSKFDKDREIFVNDFEVPQLITGVDDDGTYITIEHMYYL